MLYPLAPYIIYSDTGLLPLESYISQNYFFSFSDSCFVLQKSDDNNDPNAPDIPKLQLGKYLGDLTNQLNPNEYIQSICVLGNFPNQGNTTFTYFLLSQGCKSYCYRLNNNTTEIKLKGIRQTMKTSSKINMETFVKTLVTTAESEERVKKSSEIGRKQAVVVPQCMIKRQETPMPLLRNVNMLKSFRFNYLKRQLVDTNSYCTLPIGYNNN